jgi:hypothetical protein
MFPIQAEFANLTFRDKRISRSFMFMLSQLAMKPDASFCAAVGKKNRKSACRIMGDENLNPDFFLSSHFAETAARAAAFDEVIIVQDTSFLTYTKHAKMEGLGTIQGPVKGFALHTALALSPFGAPLGLVGQRAWARGTENAPESESDKWRLFGLEYAKNRLPDTLNVFLVQDREADAFGFLSLERPKNVNLILRVFHPRKYVFPEFDAESSCTLKNGIDRLKVAGVKCHSIFRKGRKTELEFEVRYGPVWIDPPKNKKGGRRLKGFWAVTVRETKNGRFPADGAEWLLLTTAPVESAEAAFGIARRYAWRWRIERFHFVLKSGCRVERLQFDDAKAVFNAVAVYSVIAWRLLAMTYAAREPDGESPPTRPKDLASDDERALLKLKFGREPANAKDLVLQIAALAEFCPSKRSPMPGVQKLWEGLRILESAVLGFKLARQFYGTT